jgi:phosphoribosylformylglycinamidine synthase
MSLEQLQAFKNILAEQMTDIVSIGEFVQDPKKEYIFKQALPGQFDQRADSAQKAALLSAGLCIKVRNTIIYEFYGINQSDLKLAQKYLINPIECRMLEGADRLTPKTLEREQTEIELPVEIVGFAELSEPRLLGFIKTHGLAMNIDDILEVQKYFRSENRNPNMCELRVLDTYWSDHCRHTTFGTHLIDIDIEDESISSAFENYLSDRIDVYGDEAENRPITLMDVATINMKRQKKLGNLPAFIDDKIENNACTILADVNGEKYQILFKNETHNHPTEIEPFGGAATCVGGAIRDPLSGRAYVYQAMRITGAGDVTQPFSKTLTGKLPQFQISRGAAHGFSSYGNQIGLATGYVREYFHPGFVAKRMEVGFVVGAVPDSQVIKCEPVEGDIILLIGGRTGRDGVGGASGSSKAHDDNSLETCGAEVQKGNAPVERSLQRLFRNSEFSTLVKKCNDFGAGGVCVAVGEIADSIDINLCKVPLKYDGLNPIEIATSESQERMAIAISPRDIDKVLALADAENLEATHIATVTNKARMRMFYHGNLVLDISRKFLDAAGAVRVQKVRVLQQKPVKKKTQFESLNDAVIQTLSDLNTTCQKGIVEMFDSTVGGRTVFHPFGGKTQNTPTQGSAMLIPQDGNVSIATLATAGYDPHIANTSSFQGSQIAVLDSLAKIVAMGGDYKNAYLTFQEYMPRQTTSERFGETLAALLGAHEMLREFKLASIGGKDSMSGTFKDINVPPTLISFALCVENAKHLISPEFKHVGSTVAVLRVQGLTVTEIKQRYDSLVELIRAGVVVSAFAVSSGGLIEAIAKMCWGNEIGFEFSASLSSVIARCEATKQSSIDITEIDSYYGDIVVELAGEVNEQYDIIGKTISEKLLKLGDESVNLDIALTAYQSTLEPIFKTKTIENDNCKQVPTVSKPRLAVADTKQRAAKVVIPVFFGTNSEDEMARAFRDAGAEVIEIVISDRTPQHVRDSITKLSQTITSANMIAFPGGFSGGDEPDGSAKLIVSMFRNESVAVAVNEMLGSRNGLVIGICNGFQALIKLGMFREGQIETVDDSFPTLGHNTIARHISEYSTIKVVNTNSPWLYSVSVGEIYKVPMSHGEGKLLISETELDIYIQKGQVFSQFVDEQSRTTMQRPFNPNGSYLAIEGLVSPCGRVLGKMGHTERVPEKGKSIVGKNIPGNKFMDIIKSGVEYIEKSEGVKK